VSRLHLEGPDGDSTIVESECPAALLIRRLEFDALLVSLAVEAGAELVTGVEIVQASQSAERVTLTARDGRRFDAPFVIAADGVHSVIARRLRVNPGWLPASMALDMMEETPRERLRDVDPTTLWVAYGYQPPGSDAPPGRRAAEGYAYIFPKRDHVNIGIGYVLEHYKQHVGQAPYELQRDFVDHLRRRGIVEGESVKDNFTPHQIPVGGPLARPAKGRVLLAGDAGGFVNGVTAEGIYYAMVTGELAASAIVQHRRQPIRQLATAYQHAWQREVGAELRDSVLIQRYLFGDRRRIARVIRGATREPEITRLILDFAIGRIGYGALRWRLLRQTPWLAARIGWELVRDRLVPRRTAPVGA
jgi:flavin-dependent dehydrogenase